MRLRASRLGIGVVLAAAVAACGDDAAMQDAEPAAIAPDSSSDEHPDVYLPGEIDAEDPLDFLPAPVPDAEPAHNLNQPIPDAAEPPFDAAPEPPRGCVPLSLGDELTIDSALAPSALWQRIEPDQCPSTHLTDRKVAYELHEVCAWGDAIMLDVTMLGADQLPDPSAVADPLLVVYEDASAMTDDPFGCVAVSDDATFFGGIGNSSRIEGLALGAGERVTIVATSYERPDQHGVGPYRLELRAR